MALAGLTGAQKRAGLDVDVAATFVASESTEQAATLQRQGIHAQAIGPARPPLRSHPDIKPTLKPLISSADIIHVHAIWEEIQHVAARLAVAAGKPYIFRPCGMLDPWSLRQSRLKKKIYMAWRLKRDLNRASAIHYTAETERDLASPLKLRPQAIVEPNGLNLSEFADLPAPEEFRRKFPQIGDRRIVLFLSRIHHKKGLDLLIPAFAQAKPDNTVLVIAGPDDQGYGATLNQLIDQHGIREHVLVPGLLKGRDRVEAFAAAELFALPSYQENFGIVVIEALAAGCPVLISDQVNIYREIDRAGVGLIVPTKMEQVAEALQKWSEGARTRRQIEDKARQFVQEHYDWNAIAARWKAHYERILAHGQR